ncbi:MAG TPA: hypothetical protein VGB51_08585 [Actinomycetota bacterium]
MLAHRRRWIALVLPLALLGLVGGGGPASADPPGNVTVVNPAGIAAAGDTLVVAEAGTGRLLSFPGSGPMSALVTGMIPGIFTRGATGVALDGSGNAYVAVADDGVVLFATPAGETGIYARGLGAPNGLAFDADGNLLVADQAGKRVLRVAPERGISVAVEGFAQAPFGLAFGPDGALYVSTHKDGKVWRATGGSPSLYASIGTSAEGIAFDAGGTLYAGDGAAGRVMKVPPPDPGFPAVATTFATDLSGPLNLAISGTGLHVAAQGEGPGATKDRVVRIGLGTTGLPLATPALSPTALPAAPDHSVVHRGGGVALDPAPYLDILPEGTATSVGLGAFEPTVGVTRTGAVFYNPKPTTTVNVQHVMRSTDQGKTWVDVSPGVPPDVIIPPTDLDPYIWTDRVTGRLFTIQLYVGCSYLAYSDNDGEDWIQNPLACGIPANDHQTFWGGPPRVLETVNYPHVLYYCFNGVLYSGCGRSIDGGLTFHPAGLPYPPGGCAGLTGHVAVGPDGIVYLPKSDCSGGPLVSVSRDDGTTWTQVQVAGAAYASGDHESHVAVDNAGNAYYTWIGPDRLPYLAMSKDGGTTWSTPQMVGPPGLTEAWAPSLAAGDRGRIAVYYTGTMANCCYSPRTGGERAWNAYVTISTDADGADPTFMTTTFNDPVDPVRRGTCGPGRCGGRPTSLGDFLEVYVDHLGRTWSAMVDSCVAACANPGLSGSPNAERGMVGQLVRGPKLIGEGNLLPPPWYTG